MYKKTLEIAENLGLKEIMAINYGNLGLIYQTKGELDKAKEMHNKALEINKRLGRLEGVANQYGNLGAVYKKRGDIEKAREYWEKAVELFKKIGMEPEIEKVQGWISKLAD